VEIAILDHSKDATTGEIINKISSSKYFSINQFIEREADIEAAFKKGEIKAVLNFENDFSKNLIKEKKATIQVITDATDPNTANTISNYINSILQNYQLDQNKDIKIAYQIVPQTRMIYNPELRSVFMFVPGVMTIILMLVSAMMTSISITREKELGTMEILLVSPLKPFQVIVGKVVPYIFLSVINAIVIIVLSIFIFKMPVQGSPLSIRFGKCIVYYYLFNIGDFDFNNFSNPTNRNDDFFNGINASCDLVIRFYFPHFKHASSFTNHKSYYPCKMVYHHLKRHYAKRGWYCFNLEGNLDFIRNDTLFYWLKY